MVDELVGRTVLGKLRVVRKLGAGGSGEVYEVEHLVTRHRRALKVLRRAVCESGEAVARLVREAAASSRLSGTFVAQAFDAGRLEDGRAYILMELVEGPTLADALEQRGKLPEVEARELARQLAVGLAEVHRAGMVHRDVKPSNVVLTRGGVRLLDFGIAKLVGGDRAAEDSLTREGVLVGTPRYMAPEQLDAGEVVGAAADVWALGAVLFELLTGEAPFPGTTPAAIAAAIHRGPAPRVRSLEPTVSEALDRVVGHALERDPATRPASMDSLAAELRAREDEPTLAAGHLVDERFEIVRLLGRGGAGVVYEALDRGSGERRALKLLALHVARRAGAEERVAREGRLAAEVAHEHVVSVLQTGRDAESGAAYLVMELCEGPTLSAKLTERGRLEPAEALAIVRAVGEALDAIHAHGVVHRDVKPGNVLLGPGGQVKLADFGLAREVDAHESATPTGVVLGTPLTMAPEQARRDVAVGPPADRYALAQLTFTLLVGRAYFEDDARAGLLPLLGAIGRGVEEPACARARRAGVELPAAFDGFFARGAHSDPARRFASSMDLANALADALRDAQPTPAPVRRRARTAAWLAAGAVGLALGGIALVSRASDAPAARPDDAQGSSASVEGDASSSGQPAPAPPETTTPEQSTAWREPVASSTREQATPVSTKRDLPTVARPAGAMTSPGPATAPGSSKPLTRPPDSLF